MIAGFLWFPNGGAQNAGVMKFAGARPSWNQLPHFRHRLQELHAMLKPEDPAREIIKTLCAALREDLGVHRTGEREDGGSNGSQTAAY